MDSILYDSLAAYLFKAALIFLTATGAALVLRRSSATARYLVWMLVMVVVLGLPLFTLLLPGWETPRMTTAVRERPPVVAPIQPSIQPPAPPTVSPASQDAPPAPAIVRPHPAAPPVAVAAPPVTPKPAIDWMRLFFLAWLAGACCFLLRIYIGLRIAHRLLRTAWRVAWAEELAAARDALRLYRPVQLYVSAKVSVPLTWGIIAPVLLLPADAEDWSPERRKLVLLHELAHAKRWDYCFQLLGQCALAVHWCNPLAWFALSRLRAEQEMACDDLLLKTGCRASDYAVHLLAIAQGLSHHPPLLTAIPMARAGGLQARLRMLLDGNVNRKVLTWTAAIALLFLIAATLIFAAMHLPERGVTVAKNGKAVLPDGAIVELVGVSYSPFFGRSWWGADGTRMEKAPFSEEYDYPDISIDPADRCRMLAFRVDHLPASSDPDFFFSDGSTISCSNLDCIMTGLGGKLGRVMIPPNSVIMFADITTDQKSLSSNRYRMGFSQGPWDTVVRLPWPDAHGKYQQKDYPTSRGESLHFTIRPTTNASSTTRTIPIQYTGVQVKYRIPVEKYQVRVQAIDLSGKVIPSFRKTFTVSSKNEKFDCTYMDQAHKDISEVIVQVRPFSRVEFRNIALFPHGASSTPPVIATPKAPEYTLAAQWAGAGRLLGEHLHAPQQIAVDASGNVYVLDVGSTEKYSNTGELLAEYPHSFWLMDSIARSYYYYDPVESAVEISTLTGKQLHKWTTRTKSDSSESYLSNIAVASGGTVYAAFTHDGMTRNKHGIEVVGGSYPYSIRRFTNGGTLLNQWTFRKSLWWDQERRPAQREGIDQMSVAPDGNLYIAGNNSCRYISPEGKLIPADNNSNGDNWSQIYIYSPSGKLVARKPLVGISDGMMRAQRTFITGMAVDASGTIFIAGSRLTGGRSEMSIRRYAPNGRYFTEVEPPISVNSSNSDQIERIALDAHGNLFVIEAFQPLVRKYSPVPLDTPVDLDVHARQ